MSAPRAIFVGLLAVAFALFGSAPEVARAHAFAPTLLDLREITVGPSGRYAGTWRAAATVAVTPIFPAHCHVEGSLEGAEGGEPARFVLDCGQAGLAGGAVRIVGLNAGADAVARVTPRVGEPITAVLRPESDTLAIPNPSARRELGPLAAGSVRLGVAHILGGVDHLLFVLGLVLLERRAWALLRTLTAFTIAHSLTLAAATLGIVAVPAAPVEAAIAASLVVVALELTRKGDASLSLTRRRPWLVAFAFGLLHGLGFAGALADVGLTPAELPIALGGFNVGVELGQILFVAAVLAARAVCRPLRLSPTPALRLAPAYVLGSLAMFFFFDRLKELFS